MPAPLILDYPRIVWPAGQFQAVPVSLTPRAGLTVADYGTLTLTVREDPLYPRSGPDVAALATADPKKAGWPVVATGTAVAVTSPVLIAVTVPAGAGTRRYAVDVVATGGAAGRVQLVDPTFLTVTPTLYDG